MAIPGSSPAHGANLIDSVRGLGSSLLALIRTRAELLALEIAEAKERSKGMLILAVVAALFLSLALQLAALVVVAVFWETYRLPAIVGVTCLYFGIGGWALLALRRKWRASPLPFAASLHELTKDLEALGRRDE
jgi:uncharacterized membrane protein YqjE